MKMTPRSILITGAASGIGRALAIALAQPGRVLHLGDRNGESLQATADLCRAARAEPVPRVQDVTDAEGTRNWVQGCGALDLVLTCAGVQFTSLISYPESDEQTRTTIAVNLMGTLNAVLPAINIMRGQPADAQGVRGRIGILASLGAFVSVPGATAYCASKAAVDNWAVGRSALARGEGIRITSICPGYVRTPLTSINGFAMHGLMEPEDAARIILRRLPSSGARMSFPWRMAAAARFGGMLPAGFPARMLARDYARRSRLTE